MVWLSKTKGGSMPEPEVNDYAARDICTGCYMKFDYKGECPECDSEEDDEDSKQINS
jgi:hypothetical protein